MLKHKLVDFIIEFMEEVDKEISEMKLFVCYSVPGLRVWQATDIMAAERKGTFRRRVFPYTCKCDKPLYCYIADIQSQFD